MGPDTEHDGAGSLSSKNWLKVSIASGTMSSNRSAIAWHPDARRKRYATGASRVPVDDDGAVHGPLPHVPGVFMCPGRWPITTCRETSSQEK